MAKRSLTSATVEEYLEWVYRLSREQEAVTVSDLSGALSVSRPSVTGMLKRLVESGLIEHEPYRSIRLTEDGRQVALRIIRRHGLLERLLCDVVGVPWHRVDDAVRHLEHYVNDEVEQRLADYLGHPATCPHGQPIDWETAGATVRLSTVEPGQCATIARIGNESPDFLEYVQRLGLLPEVVVSVVSRALFGGPSMIRVGAMEHALGEGVLNHIWVDCESIRDDCETNKEHA